MACPLPTQCFTLRNRPSWPSSARVQTSWATCSLWSRRRALSGSGSRLRPLRGPLNVAADTAKRVCLRTVRSHHPDLTGAHVHRLLRRGAHKGNVVVVERPGRRPVTPPGFAGQMTGQAGGEIVDIDPVNGLDSQLTAVRGVGDLIARRGEGRRG